MDEYNKFLRMSLDYKQAREDRHKDISRSQLYKMTKKKLETTMIGALSTVEECFGFLWGFNESDMELTPEQKHMHEIFNDARAKILDRGNTQIRNLESDFLSYDISKKKNFITLPVMNNLEGDTNDGKEID